MKVKVLIRFNDMKDKVTREIAEEFETEETRARELERLGLVSIIRAVEVPEDKKPLARKASPKRK